LATPIHQPDVAVANIGNADSSTPRNRCQHWQRQFIQPRVAVVNIDNGEVPSEALSTLTTEKSRPKRCQH